MRPSTAFLLLSAICVVGCSRPKLTPVERPTTKKNLSTAWTLVETTPSPGPLPLIGSEGHVYRVGPDGVVVGEDWNVVWTVNGERLASEGATAYKQTLDLEKGTLVTEWTQDCNGVEVDVRCDTRVDREPVQVWKFSAARPTDYSVTTQVFLVSGPEGDEPASGPSEGRLSPSASTFLLASREVLNTSYAHTPHYADIQIDGPIEDQQAVRSFLYYLNALYGPAQTTYSPMGGSNELFADRTFWDADVWLLPALALINPHTASNIAALRSKHANSELYDAWIQQGRPTATRITTERDPGLASMAKTKPIKYPWQAGPNGEERSTQPTRFAEHVSGDVAWGAVFASDLGLTTNGQAKQIVDGVAAYYLHRARLGNDQKVGIEDTVSVDEWHTGDDDLYTNAVADWVVRKSLGSQLWPADAMRYPNDYGGLIAYEGDPRKAYQQAAAQLVLWPLEMEGLVGDPIEFLDRFAGKEAPTGPAMSLSVNALVRARYGSANQALDEWRESWKRYTQGNPFLLFSEKPNQPDRTYFGTGAAGCLNAVIYGFAGGRIVEDATNDKAKIAIANDKWLVFRPNLPSEWKRLNLKGITVMGRKYDITCIGRTATIEVAGT